MNTTLTPPDLKSPLPDTRDGWRPLVAVRVSIPHAVPYFFPAGNYIAMVLLGHACADALTRENLLEKELPIYAGHFNDSWYLFEVSNAPRALELLEDILNRFHLRVFSTLLFYHTKLLLFQPHGLDGANIGRGFTLEKMHAALERVQAEHDAIKKAMETFRALQQEQKPPAPQNEPPQPPE